MGETGILSTPIEPVPISYMPREMIRTLPKKPTQSAMISMPYQAFVPFGSSTLMLIVMG